MEGDKYQVGPGWIAGSFQVYSVGPRGGIRQVALYWGVMGEKIAKSVAETLNRFQKDEVFS